MGRTEQTKLPTKVIIYNGKTTFIGKNNYLWGVNCAQHSGNPPKQAHDHWVTSLYLPYERGVAVGRGVVESGIGTTDNRITATQYNTNSQKKFRL